LRNLPSVVKGNYPRSSSWPVSSLTKVEEFADDVAKR
jgi:hypothetical protein